jgi:hypothetical protein
VPLPSLPHLPLLPAFTLNLCRENHLFHHLIIKPAATIISLPSPKSTRACLQIHTMTASSLKPNRDHHNSLTYNCIKITASTGSTRDKEEEKKTVLYLRRCCRRTRVQPMPSPQSTSAHHRLAPRRAAIPCSIHTGASTAALCTTAQPFTAPI